MKAPALSWIQLLGCVQEHDHEHRDLTQRAAYVTIKQIADAMREADRFIKAGRIAIARIKKEDKHDGNDDSIRSLIGGSKETAACRRASLDLTRALADMRNNLFDRR